MRTIGASRVIAMPLWEVPLPIGAKNIQVELQGGQRLPLQPSYYRPTSNGDVPILAFFAGDSFVGDVLEGHWSALDRPISDLYVRPSNGRLVAHMASDADGVMRSAAYTSSGIILRGYKLAVRIGTEDASLPSGMAYLDVVISDKRGTWPDRCLMLRVRLDEDGSRLMVGWRTEDGWQPGWNSQYSSSGIEGEFEVELGEVVAVRHDGEAVLEASTWMGQPLYATIRIGSNSTEAAHAFCRYIRVLEAPSPRLLYDVGVEDIAKGGACILDTLGLEGPSGWQQVLSRGHVFKGDCVANNGLCRLWLSLAGQYASDSARLELWANGAWRHLVDFRVKGGATRVSDIVLEAVGPELASIRAQLEGEEGRTIARFMLGRGMPIQVEHVQGDSIDVVPAGELGGTSRACRRDGLDPDYDAWLEADNFFWKLAEGSLLIIGASRSSLCWRLKQLRLEGGTRSAIHAIAIPFNAVKEAEDAMLIGGAEVDTSLEDDSGDSVRLSAEGDGLAWALTAGEELPIGRYRLFIRAKQSSEPSSVEGDLRVLAQNKTDGRDLTIPPGPNALTPGLDFSYLLACLELSSADVGDEVEIRAEKASGQENTIWVDYLALIPVAGGAGWPQDVSHNALRPVRLNLSIAPR